MTNWQDSIRNSLRSSKELASFLNREIPETSYKVMIPKSFALKIEQSQALQKQFLPSPKEDTIKAGLLDPIGDHLHSNVNRLVHRYSNRALFFPTEVCPILCRYCFRKNELSAQDQLFSHSNDDKEIRDYLTRHPEIEEIIFTGGDPLILSDDKLSYWLDFFSSISSIKMIRFHTRTPVILPERINNKFTELIKKYSKKFNILTLVVHTNHIDEWTNSFDEACSVLRMLPIQLISQSVLLKDVNDNTSTLKELFYGLAQRGIKPYYLHHPDKARGAMHFYLSLEDGQKIYNELKKSISGWALPKYVVETDHGGGKITVENALYNIDKKDTIS